MRPLEASAPSLTPEYSFAFPHIECPPTRRESVFESNLEVHKSRYRRYAIGINNEEHVVARWRVAVVRKDRRAGHAIDHGLGGTRDAERSIDSFRVLYGAIETTHL
jgi:hypothetical protein